MPATTNLPYQLSVNTPFRKLGLSFEADKLCKIIFLNSAAKDKTSLAVHQLQAVAALKNYCRDPKYNFDLPVAINGSEFQRRVWQQIQQINSGEVRSYGEIAQKLHSSARAVANACAKNPLPIIIPCHRVVAKNHLGGYAKETLGNSPCGYMRIKAWLLLHEGALEQKILP